MHSSPFDPTQHPFDDDNRPLYSIDDSVIPPHDINKDDDDDLDDLDDIEIENDDTEADAEIPSGPSPLGIMFKTMFTPVEGWKALRRAHFTAESFASGCFYPLVGLAALSEGAAMFYEADFSVAQWGMRAIVTFVTFFFGYFTILLFGAFMLPKRSRPILKKEVGKQFVMLSLSTLALFLTSINLVPMLEPVLVFLPLWTIYLVIKGIRLMRVPHDCINSTIGMMCLLLLGAPMLWHWLMMEIIPL